MIFTLINLKLYIHEHDECMAEFLFKPGVSETPET